MNNTLFFQKPRRYTQDTQAIELTDFSATSPTLPSAVNTYSDSGDDDYCCAIEMAILPIAAAHESVMESWQEACIIAANRESLLSNNFNEYLTVVIAAPFAYTPALLMAIIGFFYGLGIDCQFAIESAIENAKDDREDEMPEEEMNNDIKFNSL